MKEDQIPLVEEFKPRKLADLYGQSSIVKTLQSLTDQHTMRNFTFYGDTPGVGKTSAVDCIGHELYGDDIDDCVFCFNASDKSSVEWVREELKDILSQAVPKGYSFIIIAIDECDGTSKQYQFALRRVIEDNINTARFLLLCNTLGKIIRPIQSRCKPLFFPPIADADIVSRLDYISMIKGIKIADLQVLQKIAEINDGSMREAIGTLDLLRFKKGEITLEDVSAASNINNDIENLYGLAKQGKLIAARSAVIGTMKSYGAAPLQIVERMMNIPLRDKEIKFVTRAKIQDQIGRTHVELGHAPNQMLQIQALLARIALITRVK